MSTHLPEGMAYWTVGTVYYYRADGSRMPDMDKISLDAAIRHSKAWPEEFNRFEDPSGRNCWIKNGEIVDYPFSHLDAVKHGV